MTKESLEQIKNYIEDLENELKKQGNYYNNLFNKFQVRSIIIYRILKCEEQKQ